MSTLRSRIRGLSLALFLGVGAFAAAPMLAMAQHGDEHGEAEAHGEEGAHAEGEHAEAGEHHEPHWDYFQFAGQLTNFAIWLTLLYILLNRMLPKFLADRRAGVVDGLEEAKRMKAEAEAKFEEYSKRIDTMDAELDRVREDMRKAGQAERDRLVADAAEKSARMHAEARFLVDQQVKQLKEELTREAIEAAIVAAEAILRQGTTPADQQRLADEYLARLKTTTAKTQPGASS